MPAGASSAQKKKKKKKNLAQEEFHDEVGSLQEYPCSLTDCLAHIDHITSRSALRVLWEGATDPGDMLSTTKSEREIGNRSAAGKEKESKILETSATLFIGTEASCSSQTNRSATEREQRQT